MLGNCYYYFAAVLFIGVWWTLAFSAIPSLRLFNAPPLLHDTATTAAVPLDATDELTALISPLDRHKIIAALNGDITTILELLITWELDADLLMAHGGTPVICRLPRDRLLTTYRQARTLLNGSEEQILALRRHHRAASIVDDRGETFYLHDRPRLLLPQTYAAASFLLAFGASPDIVALPRGLRCQQKLFPMTPFHTIAHDSDRYHAELVACHHPDLAIVAEYSDPAFLAALTDQKVPLFTMTAPDDIHGLIDGMVRLGHLVDRSPEALILATFLEGALLHLDTRKAIATIAGRIPRRPLFLFSYSNQWYLPTARTLTSALLNHLSLSPPADAFSHGSAAQGADGCWLMPLSLEEIAVYDPDHLIIAVGDPSYCENLRHERPFCELTACRRGHLYTVDATVQESIAQHIVLAAFDLWSTVVDSDER